MKPTDLPSPDLGDVHFRFTVPPLELETYRKVSSMLWRRIMPTVKPTGKTLDARVMVAMLVSAIISGLAGFYNIGLTFGVIETESIETLLSFGTSGTIVILLIPLVVAALLLLWYTPRHQKRVVRWSLENNPSLNAPYELILCGEGVISRTATGITAHNWRAITSRFEWNTTQVIVFQFNSFFWIPDALIADKPAFQAFIGSQIAAPPA